MTKIRWLLVTLLALVVFSASGISPANAASVTQPRDLTASTSTAAVPPTFGTCSSSGGGSADGDPDDIIEGNRLIALANSLSTVTGLPASAAVLLCARVGGAILLLRRLMP